MPKIKIEMGGWDEMEKSSRGGSGSIPVHSIAALEADFKGATTAVRAHVHVLTGRLLASGRADTHFNGNKWSGEIQYAAHPGIFELARGDVPSLHHPEGGHFFFEAADPFLPSFEAHINEAARSMLKGENL